MGPSQSRPHDVNQSIDPHLPADFYGLFSGGEKATNGNEEQKVKTVRKRVMDAKAVMIKDAHILWALRSAFARGDVDRAYDFLLVLSDSSEFIIRDYDPRIKLLGSENRQGVTCYLDSVLFSIFAKLDSFEAMLINDFEDIYKARLGLLLRVWVNLLRSGTLITADFAALIQTALSDCGWEDAANLRQQDASEAFTFITGKLELPLLTLRMDIFHTGKEDEKDDHKLINERLLEVAIPSLDGDDTKTITLEECLEEYFNNRIEVRRYLERRSTMNSIRSFDNSKKDVVHVETVEVDSDVSSLTPLSGSPSNVSAVRPLNRNRTASIIQERYLTDRSESGYSVLTNVDSKGPLGRVRRGSLRKEVMMPAWQFFSLIPWYTDNAPSNDAQVAAHFSSKRPVLGICLKRYTVDSKGNPFRLSTQVDIPTEIGLPHFIQDDHLHDEGPLYGNFKLSLQSVVCHRGHSVHSGHYIAFVRSTTSVDSPATVEDSSYWMRFDDLATQARVTLADISKALISEMPYLLFYQIVPIEEDAGRIMNQAPPPAYAAPDTHELAEHSTASVRLEDSHNAHPSSGRPDVEVTSNSRGRAPEAESGTGIAVANASSTVNPLQQISEEEHTPRQSSRHASPAGRGSESLHRTHSHTSDELVRSPIKMAGNRSKEALPAEAVRDSHVHVLEVSESTPRAEDARRTSPKVAPHRGHKREKSKNRLSKTDKPDRECVLM